MLQLNCKRCENVSDIGGKRSRLRTGASGCGFAPDIRATMMRSSQQTHHRSQWRGGGSPSPSSLEVQITSKSHLTQHSNNLYDKNKTHRSTSKERKGNKNKINMLVHICHNSMSFTYKMHNHKDPQTDAGGTGQ